MSIIYTGGTFDLFHSGHVNLLRRCFELAGPSGEVVVSINTDEFIQSYKGSPPVCSESEREAVLESCQYVTRVVRNVGGADSKPAIELVQPDYIAIGTDWARRNYYEQMSIYPGLVGRTKHWTDLHSL